MVALTCTAGALIFLAAAAYALREGEIVLACVLVGFMLIELALALM